MVRGNIESILQLHTNANVRFGSEADTRKPLVSTEDANSKEFLNSSAFDSPRFAKFTYKLPHSRKVLVEDWDHAALAIGPYCMVHKFSVFRLCKSFVITELAPPEIFTVVRSVVKDNPIDISFVVRTPLSVSILQ